MINSIKKAFTLAEIMFAATVVLVVMALVLPTINRVMPNSDVVRFKKIYTSVLTVVDSMMQDARVYPDFRGFADTSRGTDSLGDVYEGDFKFANFFISKLNVIDDDYEVDGTFPYGIVYETRYRDANYMVGVQNRTGVLEEVEEGLHTADSFPCVKVNTREIFCLPPRVDTLDANNPNSDNAIYVRVYMNDDDFSEQNAFYIAVRANGKVSLPTAGATFNCKESDANGRMRFANYNQCQVATQLDSI